MTVKEVEARFEATEKEISDIKGAIITFCGKVEEQRAMSERIQSMLEGFMSEIIGGKTLSLT